MMAGENIKIRPISPADGENGLFSVYSQLTKAPPIAPEKFAHLVHEERSKGLRQTLVAVNENGIVIGTGAVLFETKFIRGGGVCAHIEDIVVDEQARGINLGKRIIHRLVDIAKEKGCYKVILDCADNNIGFYQRCGFEVKERQMALYF